MILVGKEKAAFSGFLIINYPKECLPFNLEAHLTLPGCSIMMDVYYLAYAALFVCEVANDVIFPRISA